MVVFDKDGNYVATCGGEGPTRIKQAVGVAVDPDGNIYVGDYGGHVVVQLDNQGVYKARFPSVASGVNAGRVTGVLYSANQLYAIDDDASSVLKFDSSGGVAKQFTTTIPEQSPLAGSVSIAVDHNGHLWIADYFYHLFAEYSSDGTLLTQHGMAGSSDEPGAFSMPYALAIDALGKIYVTDVGNKSVQRFSGQGQFEAALPTGSALPSGIAVAADGRIYVSDATNNVVNVYRP